MRFRRYDPTKRISFLPIFWIILFALMGMFLAQGACKKKEQSEGQNLNKSATVRKPIPEPQEKPDEPEPPAEAEEIQPDLAQTPGAETIVKSATNSVEEQYGNTGFYSTQPGDTLVKVSSLKTVYDDPDKWTSLFQLNTEALAWMETARDVEEKELPQGTGLRFVTEPEAGENLARLGPNVYAINVLSAETKKKIIPQTLLLLKKGYHAYITSTILNEKRWLRLRVGFFQTRAEAQAVEEQIRSVLENAQLWVTKVSESERTRFGGYIE